MTVRKEVLSLSMAIDLIVMELGKAESLPGQYGIKPIEPHGNS